MVSRGRAVTVFRDADTGTSRRLTDDERRTMLRSLLRHRHPDGPLPIRQAALEGLAGLAVAEEHTQQERPAHALRAAVRLLGAAAATRP